MTTRLGPGCLGQRVVIRRRVPGETGPSGGPAFTDVLGVLEHWGDHWDDEVAVRTSEGTLVRFPRSLIVAGKPVPPKPSMRMRISAADLSMHAVSSWQPVETIRAHGWLLRAANGYSARANSALATSPPDEWEDALAATTSFYSDRGLPAWAQVIAGSPEHSNLLGRGWTTARPGEADCVMLLAGVAHALRTTRGVSRDAPVELGERLPSSWLDTDTRAGADPAMAKQLMQAGDASFFSLYDKGALTARARSVVHGSWVGITDVWTRPEARRQGFARMVLDTLLDHAGSQGAQSAYLATHTTNAAALDFYATLSFEAHHNLCYLAAP